MSEQLAPLLFWLVVLIPVGVFVRQIHQVRNGVRGKAKGTALFFCFSFVPVLAYALAFLALVGVEEVTKHAMIGEGFSRMLFPVIGIGAVEVLLLTGIFAIVVNFLRPAKKITSRH